MGVGEHTDYGLLTLLRQDDAGGLQVKTKQGWIEAPPVPASLVCNIGDMLDRMTGGLYRSTPHRAATTPAAASGCRSRSSSIPTSMPRSRRSAVPRPTIARRAGTGERARVRGQYGDYLLGKVGKVFPELRRLSDF